MFRLRRLGSALFLCAMLLIAPSLLITSAQSSSKPECQRTCGNLTIPYPFGVKGDNEDCYLPRDDGYFTVDCNTATDPPIPYWTNTSSKLQITNISVVDHEMRIKVFVAHDCYNASGLESRNSPWSTLGTFPISSTKNTFTAVGCDTNAVFRGSKDGEYAMGCMSLCSSITDVANGTCSGIGCCQTSIPRNVKSYNISLTSFRNHSVILGFNPCSYAFVAANGYFNFSSEYLQDMKDEKVPIVLDWAVGHQSCSVAQTNSLNFKCKENTVCTDADNGSGYRCHCRDGYEGNPYLSGSDGCQDIDECKTTNLCSHNSSCQNLLGSYNCSCSPGYEGNGWTNGTSCSLIQHRKKYIGRDIALAVGMSALFLLLCAALFAMALLQRKAARERRKFFKDNGGLVLQTLLSQHQSSVPTLEVFTAEELKNATDNYHESRILGQGGQGTVYKGTISNNRTVAIKKAKMLDRSQVKEFINEVVLLSQINHKNVVKLIGCCLETELPHLVYEFVSNGTLSEHLHDDGKNSTPLSSWTARLRVAAETAGALSYLHSDVSIPIFHRDVKGANILLDENYTAKVSDFGASRMVPSDVNELTTIVQGTFGYLDPEYFHSGQLTEKSDVYSFGVVLAELLTGMKAIRFDKPEKERYLAMSFALAVKEDRYLEIVDERIMNKENNEHIREVVWLASRCLKVRGEDRPSMKEVALELEGLLRATSMHPWIHKDSDNIQETEYLLGGISIASPDGTGPISTTGSEDTMKSQLLAFNVAHVR